MNPAKLKLAASTPGVMALLVAVLAALAIAAALAGRYPIAFADVAEALMRRLPAAQQLNRPWRCLH